MRVGEWPLVAVMTLSLAGATACNRQDEGERVRRQAEAALKRASIPDVTLDWDKDARVLHLKGTVPDDRSRAYAEQAAQDAVGTSVKVANELTLKGADSRTADDLDGSIRKLVSNLYDADQGLKSRDIDVDVNNGVVTLTGDVQSAGERDRADKMARSVPGVREVVNSLQVRARSE